MKTISIRKWVEDHRGQIARSEMASVLRFEFPFITVVTMPVIEYLHIDIGFFEWFDHEDRENLFQYANQFYFSNYSDALMFKLMISSV